MSPEMPVLMMVGGGSLVLLILNRVEMMAYQFASPFAVFNEMMAPLVTVIVIALLAYLGTCAPPRAQWKCWDKAAFVFVLTAVCAAVSNVGTRPRMRVCACASSCCGASTWLLAGRLVLVDVGLRNGSESLLFRDGEPAALRTPVYRIQS